MAQRSVYVETSILSFLSAEPSTVQKTFEKQRDTVQWWAVHRPLVDACVSQAVVIEAGAGNPLYAARRITYAKQLRQLPSLDDDRRLAAEFLTHKLIPAAADLDALHLAIAVRTGMDILLTWNLRHLANAETLPLVYNYLQSAGHHIPAIMTPSAFMELPHG